MKNKSKTREYIESILIAVVIALFIRSFIVEPFKIPSSSMVPTLLVGDHIFVNKFIYGLRPPFTKKHFFQFKTPDRGDVIVFIYPVDESKDFIKRVVGLPGDIVKADGKDLYINGEKVEDTPIFVEANKEDKRKLDVTNNGWSKSSLPYVEGWDELDFAKENLGAAEHLVQFERHYHWRPMGYFMREHGGEIKIPEDHLFVMGDNRDNSSDGREWGLVPMENIKGKAMFVWLSLDHDFGWLRWKRFGTWIR